MWLTLSSALLLTLRMTLGFPQGNWFAQESIQGETVNNEVLSPSADSLQTESLLPMQDVLWRRKRSEDADAKTFQSSWDEKQRGIKKMRELHEFHGRDSGEEHGYNSLDMKWISAWNMGPIERRKYILDTDPRLRFGYPLSQPLTGRSNHYNFGYYKDMNVAGAET